MHVKSGTLLRPVNVALWNSVIPVRHLRKESEGHGCVYVYAFASENDTLKHKLLDLSSRCTRKKCTS